MRRVAVVAPREAEEARAAIAALRAIEASREVELVAVIAAGEAGVVLRDAGFECVLEEEGVGAALGGCGAEIALLFDPEASDAVAARGAGFGVRVGWGSQLGALTHAVAPALLRGGVFRPDRARVYLDIVGLCGVLAMEEPEDGEVCVPPGRVLLRLPNWLGDLVQCEPLLRAFQGSAERLSIVGPGFGEELLGAELAGATWLHRDVGASAWRGHELALLLDGSLRSAWRAARARIPARVSWSRGGKGWLLTEGVRAPRELGGVAFGCGRAGSSPRWLPRPFYVSVAELASACGIAVASGPPRLGVSDEGRARAGELLARAGIEGDFVLAAVGGRVGSAKAAPVETWAALVRAFRARSPVPVLLTCGPGEEGSLAAVAGELSELGVATTGAATGLAALTGLMERCSAFLVADSGPRHLAAALGRPSVVLHGPTDPRYSGLAGAPVRVSRLELDCAPCHLERCPLRGAEHMACFGEDHAVGAAAMLGELLEHEPEDAPEDESSRR